MALATPLLFQAAHYALNVSISSAEPLDDLVEELAPILLDLRQRIVHELESAKPD